MEGSRKILLERIFVVVVLLIIAISTLSIVKALKAPGSSILPTSTPSTSFDAVVKEDGFCFFENSRSESRAFIPQNKIVGVIGKNVTGEVILLRWEDFADCWMLERLLDLQDKNVDILRVIDTSFPPETIFLLAQPTEEPTEAPTEEPTEEPIQPAFDVEVDIKTIVCACGGKAGKARITLTFKGGKAPYTVNGQTPVNGNTTSFETILDIPIKLRVVSSDEQVWEDVVKVPYCSVPDDQCNNPPPPPMPEPTK